MNDNKPSPLINSDKPTNYLNVFQNRVAQPQQNLEPVTVQDDKPSWMKYKEEAETKFLDEKSRNNYIKQQLINENPRYKANNIFKESDFNLNRFRSWYGSQPEQSEIEEYKQQYPSSLPTTPIPTNQRQTLDLNNYKSKEQVTQLQELLKQEGYDLGNYGSNKDGVDGMIGSKTRSALQEYNENVNKASLLFNPRQKEYGKAYDCPEGQCSEYQVNELHRISNMQVPIDEFIDQTGLGKDAWKLSKSILDKGGEYIYNKSDSVDRSSTPKQVGDVVVMYTGGSSEYQGVANRDGDGNTHTGFISKVYPDGSYDIDHNLHKSGGKDKSGNTIWIGQAKTHHVKNNKLQDSSITVSKILRPKYEGLNPKTSSYDPSIKLTKKPSNKIEADMLNFYNSNKEKISKRFNLEEDENVALAQLALGIINQETQFGNTFLKEVGGVTLNVKDSYEKAVEAYKKLKSEFNDKKTYGKNEEASKGFGRIKHSINFNKGELDMLTKEFKASQGSAEGDFISTMALLNESYQEFLKAGFSKQDALYRAAAKHNSPRKANSKYADNYDVDYANKAIMNYDAFAVRNGSDTLRTAMHDLKLRTLDKSLEIPSLQRSLVKPDAAPLPEKSAKQWAEEGLAKLRRAFQQGGKLTFDQTLPGTESYRKAYDTKRLGQFNRQTNTFGAAQDLDAVTVSAPRMTLKERYAEMNPGKVSPERPKEYLNLSQTDLRRKDVMAPNQRALAAGKTGAAGRSYSDFHGDLMSMGTPMPFLQKMGKVPTVSNITKTFKNSNLIKESSPIRNVMMEAIPEAENFGKYYLNNPEYLNRLNNFGYDFKNLDNSFRNMNKMSMNSRLDDPRTLGEYRVTVNPQVSTEHGVYPTAFIQSQKVSLNPTKLKDADATGSTVWHELGHASQFNFGMMDKIKKHIDKSISKNYKDFELAHQKISLQKYADMEYNSRPEEIHARIIELRRAMNPTNPFEKVSSVPTNLRSKFRLEHVFDESSLVKLMNTLPAVGGVGVLNTLNKKENEK